MSAAQRPGCVECGAAIQSNAPEETHCNAHIPRLVCVAHIEPEDGGDPLILQVSELGRLPDLVGKSAETYTLRIEWMSRLEFEAIGEWNGF